MCGGRWSVVVTGQLYEWHCSEIGRKMLNTIERHSRNVNPMELYVIRLSISQNSPDFHLITAVCTSQMGLTNYPICFTWQALLWAEIHQRCILQNRLRAYVTKIGEIASCVLIPQFYGRRSYLKNEVNQFLLRNTLITEPVAAIRQTKYQSILHTTYMFIFLFKFQWNCLWRPSWQSFTMRNNLVP